MQAWQGRCGKGRRPGRKRRETMRKGASGDSRAGWVRPWRIGWDNHDPCEFLRLLRDVCSFAPCGWSLRGGDGAKGVRGADRAECGGVRVALVAAGVAACVAAVAMAATSTTTTTPFPMCVPCSRTSPSPLRVL